MRFFRARPEYMARRGRSCPCTRVAVCCVSLERRPRITRPPHYTPPHVQMMAHEKEPFFGENSLHILSVNSHEDEMCELIELALRVLDNDSVTALLTAQCTGLFFDVPRAFRTGLGVETKGSWHRSIPLVLFGRTLR